MADNIEKKDVTEAPKEGQKIELKSDDAEKMRRSRSEYVASLFGRGLKERIDIGIVFKNEESALDLSLTDLGKKKNALEQGRLELAKRDKDFAESEKHMNNTLQPFEGERRELLLRALDHKLNPIQKESEKENPVKPEERAKFDRVLGELDARSEPGKEDAFHLAAYMHLLAEQVHGAQDKLSDASSRDIESRTNAVQANQGLIGAITSQPTAVSQISKIVKKADMPEEDKIRAVDGVLTELREPAEREALERYLRDGENSQRAADLAAEIADAKRTIRTSGEKLSRLQELSEEEQLLAQIPEEAGEKLGRLEMEKVENAGEE